MLYDIFCQNGSVELEAEWQLETYEIYFMRMGYCDDYAMQEHSFSTITYTILDEIILPDHPVPVGCAFIGWFLHEEMPDTKWEDLDEYFFFGITLDQLEVTVDSQVAKAALEEYEIKTVNTTY